jgi:hypothetical protein
MSKLSVHSIVDRARFACQSQLDEGLALCDHQVTTHGGNNSYVNCSIWSNLPSLEVLIIRAKSRLIILFEEAETPTLCAASPKSEAASHSVPHLRTTRWPAQN